LTRKGLLAIFWLIQEWRKSLYFHIAKHYDPAVWCLASFFEILINSHLLSGMLIDYQCMSIGLFDKLWPVVLPFSFTVYL
jgi:hypothetical protein